jgi:DNA-binding PadR family transcriptional regulator
MTDLMILAMLLPGPKHGYQLKREAGIILGHDVLHNNLVYPLLRRFMNNKWVSRKAAPGQRGQTRHQYSLTALGRRELLARLGSFTEQDARSADAFRLRVGLFWLLQPEIRERIMEAREKALRARMAHMTNVRDNFSLDRYAGEVTTHMQAEAESELDWIAHLRRLEKSRKDDSDE